MGRIQGSSLIPEESLTPNETCYIFTDPGLLPVAYLSGLLLGRWPTGRLEAPLFGFMIYFSYALYFQFLFVFCFHFRPRPYLFKGDHKFPTDKENLPVIILYAEMGTRAFRKFHTVLSEKAQNGEILYVLRHYSQVHACFIQEYFGYKNFFITTFYNFSTRFYIITSPRILISDNTTIKCEFYVEKYIGILCLFWKVSCLCFFPLSYIYLEQIYNLDKKQNHTTIGCIIFGRTNKHSYF